MTNGFTPEETNYKHAAYQRAYRERANHGRSGVRAELWRKQDGLCYLCQRELGPHRMAVIEHDHRCCPPARSCDVCRRGLACGPCNRIIAFVSDDPALLELIAANLRNAVNEVTARL